jgi:hypothetical protein
MNRVSARRFVALMFSIATLSSVTFSQLNNVDFLRAAPDDGIKFIEAYMSPWANAFGAGLNGSWYNTAKPHKLGGFDITFGINVGVVPESDKTFDISTLNLPSANYSPVSGLTPTIAGSKTGGPEITYSQTFNTTSYPLATFNTPGGSNLRYIPVPTLQVGIGLPLGTEIKGRFIPRIPIEGENDVMLWGVGLMHSIMQYIPGNELLPVDASIFAGYTRLNGNVELRMIPDPFAVTNYTIYNVATSFSDQKLTATVEALNISAIASFNLPVITFYGGLGYSKTRTRVDLSGNFPTPVLVTPMAAAPYVEYNDSGVKTGADFGNIDIKNFSGLRANVGFRIKLAVITIHCDYTRAQYNVISTGLGISFR